MTFKIKLKLKKIVGTFEWNMKMWKIKWLKMKCDFKLALGLYPTIAAVW